MDTVQPDGVNSSSNVDAQDAASELRVRNHAGSILTWIAVATLGTFALSIVASHAPARVRLLGLFFLGFGILVGWSTVRIATLLRVRPGRSTLVMTTMLLALIGLVATTWETARLDELHGKRTIEDEKKQREAQLAAQLMREFERQQPGSPLQPISAGTQHRVQAYLTRRVSQMGDWSPPWPVVFWAVEMIAASLAAGWTANRLAQKTPEEK